VILWFFHKKTMTGRDVTTRDSAASRAGFGVLMADEYDASMHEQRRQAELCLADASHDCCMKNAPVEDQRDNSMPSE